MKKNANFYFLVSLIAVMSWVVITSLGFKRLEAQLLPILTSGIIILLAAGGLFVEILNNRKQTTDEGENDLWNSERSRRFVAIMGWVMGFFFAVYVLGFLAAIPLSVLLYLKMRGRPWRTAITFAALLTISVYLVFELGLKSDLYKGLLFSVIDR